jgi:hypothetical protein
LKKKEEKKRGKEKSLLLAFEVTHKKCLQARGLFRHQLPPLANTIKEIKYVVASPVEGRDPAVPYSFKARVP